MNMTDIPYMGYLKLKDILVHYTSSSHAQMSEEEVETADDSVHVVFIHGAGATSKCFAFIQSQLSPTKFTHLEYDVSAGFWNNLDHMIQQIKDLDNIFIISHSLGGIYAIHLQNQLSDKILGVVSMSTPFHGSKMARVMTVLFPKNCLFREISPSAKPIKDTYDMTIRVPWLQIVSTAGGVPWHISENDGVVTTASMMDRSDVEIATVTSCHYEILVDPTVLSHIQHRISTIQKT